MRIFPNQIYEQGYFEEGKFIDKHLNGKQKNKNSSKQINLNEFYSIESHVNEIENAVPKEKEDKKKYKNILVINQGLASTSSQTQ